MTVPNFAAPQFTASDSIANDFNPRVVALTGGGYVVAWDGFAQGDPDGGSVAFARVYGADDQPLGPGFAVPADLAGADGLEQIVALPGGGFAVLYRAGPLFGPGALSANVVLYDATGTQVGAEASIPMGETGAIIGLEAFSDGRLAVLTTAFNVATELTVIGTGGAIEVERVVTGFDVASVDQADMLVAGRAGEVVGLFREVGVPVSSRAITVAGFDAAGQQTFATPLPGFTEGGFYEIERLSNGDYLVATGNGGPISAVRIAPDGTAGAIFTIPTTGLSFPSLQDVVADDAGGYMIVVFDDQDLWGLKFDGSDALEGPATSLHTTKAGSQSFARGAYLDDGDLIVAFSNGTPDNIFTADVQRLSPNAPPNGAAPTDITLTSDPVARDEAGALIGTLSATDPDAGDTFTFEVVGASFIRSLFAIDGDQLSFASGILPTALGRTDVTIQVTDSRFNSFTETLQFELASDNGGGGGGGGGETAAPVIWRGNNRANRKNGDSGDDVLNGRGGNDRLDGKGGNDKLIGGNGNDRLKGAAGADELNGGRGRDILTGGGGRDDFVFGRRDGRDRITDFQTGVDDLEFTSGATRFGDLRISQRGDDLLVRNGRAVVTLEDVDRSDFDRGDVAFG